MLSRRVTDDFPRFCCRGGRYRRAKDEVTASRVQVQAEQGSVTGNIERLKALEIKIRKDLDDASTCVRWLKEAKVGGGSCSVQFLSNFASAGIWRGWRWSFGI